MPNVSNDLSQKLYATMEKHKEVYKCELVLAKYSYYFIGLYNCKNISDQSCHIDAAL